MGTKGTVVKKTSAGQTFIDILNLCSDLDLEHSNHIFSQDTLAYDDVHIRLNLVAKGSAVQKVQWKQSSLHSPHCDLGLEVSIPIFLHDTLAMMMHHHAKFGNKSLSSSEHIIRT